MYIYFYISYKIYTVLYIRCTTSGGREGRGEVVEGLPCPIWKIEKSHSDFGKKTLFVCIYELNFHLKCSFQSISKKKYKNIYLQDSYSNYFKKPPLLQKIPGYYIFI